MRILLLGNKGMLGNAIWKHFRKEHPNFIMETITDRWPEDKFLDKINNYNGDYIINCIGSIPQKNDKFEINYKLPIWLDNNAICSIIHPGTDCEMDNDNYGISKKKAADYIANYGSKTKILKTSIIGHEDYSSYSLLDWFLNSDGEVHGFSRVYWNGNTTLQWAKQCYEMMTNWNEYNTTTILFTDNISKYELLKIIKIVYNKDIKIIKKGGFVIDKCLNGNIKGPSIKQQLIELKLLYNK